MGREDIRSSRARGRTLRRPPVRPRVRYADATVEVSSPDPPGDVSVQPDGDTALIRVGDPVASGQVGRYTAWAMALGEADRWSEPARTATVPAGGRYEPYLYGAGYGPVSLTGWGRTSVAPSSSSGSSSGSSGSVGGGSGGGGGGSW